MDKFIEIATYLGAIAGVIVSLGIIWTKGLKPFYQMIKKMDAMHDNLEKLPDWCASVDESLKQLHPNGGRSLKDRVEQTHLMMVEHLENHDRQNIGRN